MKYTEIDVELPPDDGNGHHVKIRIGGNQVQPGRGNPADHKANYLAPHVLQNTDGPARPKLLPAVPSPALPGSGGAVANLKKSWRLFLSRLCGGMP